MAFLKRHKKLTIGLGIVLILVVIFLAVRGNSAPPGSQFQTAEITRGNLIATVGATGSVRAQSSAVLMWQANGTVDAVNVEVGDRVTPDMVLASLDRTSLSQNIILAEADLVSAQQALDDLQDSGTTAAEAAIALDKAEQVYKKAYDYRQSLNGRITIREAVIVRGVPQIREYKGQADAETIADADQKLALALAQLEDAQRAYDRVKDGASAQDIAAAEARVAAAQATLNMAHITAPFAGTVTQASPSVGDQVAAGSIAFRVDDLSHLLVDVQVSEVDINNVATGQPVTLIFDAILGKEYQGQVVEVGQAGDVVQGIVNFTVTVEITDADEMVKPGMTAAVNITVKELDDVLLVPNRAVRLVDAERVVYVLRDGAPVKVQIELGQSSDTMSVLASGELQEGDQVILNPPAEGGGPFGGG